MKFVKLSAQLFTSKFSALLARVFWIHLFHDFPPLDLQVMQVFPYDIMEQKNKNKNGNPECLLNTILEWEFRNISKYCYLGGSINPNLKNTGVFLRTLLLYCICKKKKEVQSLTKYTLSMLHKYRITLLLVHPIQLLPGMLVTFEMVATMLFPTIHPVFFKNNIMILWHYCICKKIRSHRSQSTQQHISCAS